MKLGRLLVALSAVTWALIPSTQARADVASTARAIVDVQLEAIARVKEGEDEVDRAIAVTYEAEGRLAEAHVRVASAAAELDRRKTVLGLRERGLSLARRREAAVRQTLTFATHQSFRVTEYLAAEERTFRDLVASLYVTGTRLREVEFAMEAAARSRDVSEFVKQLQQFELSAGRQDRLVEWIAWHRDRHEALRLAALAEAEVRSAATAAAQQRRDRAMARVRGQREVHIQMLNRRRAATRAVGSAERRAAAAHANVEQLRAVADDVSAEYAWKAGWIGSQGLAWPLDGEPTSGFGPRMHPILAKTRLHAGVDVPGGTGEPISAAGDGVVTAAGAGGGYGLRVEIDHGDGVATLYGHASLLLVTPGQYVSAGDPIALVGSTGLSTGPHLHFEIRMHGVPQDPMQWFW